MKKLRILGIVVLLVMGGVLIAMKLNRRAEVMAQNEQTARRNAEILEENARDNAAAQEASPVSTGGEIVPQEPPAFIATTPVARDAQLKLAEELVAKAGELWKAGKKVESISAGNAALDIYDAQYGKQDERTVKLRVQITKAKMEVMMPKGK
ncbi:hypothetical protein IT570_03880 [Candidatus Sumerlaeota bacterium]|nr:hypothetical protein [Candidatus Sumerlaeota bacterium]